LSSPDQGMLRRTFTLVMPDAKRPTDHRSEVPSLTDVTLFSKAQSDHERVQNASNVLQLVLVFALLDGRRRAEAVTGEGRDDDVVRESGRVGVELFQVGEEREELEERT
jgi:maltooligosyltrehalose synthase